MKMVLIHGYGIGISYSFFKKAEGEDAGFHAFADLIKNKQAKVFRWDMPVDFNTIDSLNIRKNHSHYLLEKKKATSEATLEKLHAFLIEQNPDVIITHSMGALLLMLTINKYKLPKSVKHLISIQADTPREMFIINSEIINQLVTKQIKWINYFCPWDQALLASALVNRYIPAGLVGMKSKLVTNKIFPLIGYANLHISSISNKKFLKELQFLQG